MSFRSKNKTPRSTNNSLEKIPEDSNEDENKLKKETLANKTAPEESVQPAIAEEAKDSGADLNVKEDQYEFIMSILKPYKKLLYFLIENGYLKERTQFCKHSIKS